LSFTKYFAVNFKIKHQNQRPCNWWTTSMNLSGLCRCIWGVRFLSSHWHCIVIAIAK